MCAERRRPMSHAPRDSLAAPHSQRSRCSRVTPCLCASPSQWLLPRDLARIVRRRDSILRRPTQVAGLLAVALSLERVLCAALLLALLPLLVSARGRDVALLSHRSGNVALQPCYRTDPVVHPASLQGCSHWGDILRAVWRVAWGPKEEATSGSDAQSQMHRLYTLTCSCTNTCTVRFYHLVRLQTCRSTTSQ